MLLPEGSHHWPVNFSSFWWDIFKGKKLPPFCSLRAQQGPHVEALSWANALIGSRCCWSVEGDSRGVWRLHCSWLIGVRMKLGVTFLDSDPPLSRFLSYALTLPHLSCLLSGCLLMPVFYVLCWDGVELCGEQTVLRFKSGSLPHLCWAFNELFYIQRLNRNRNL